MQKITAALIATIAYAADTEAEWKRLAPESRPRLHAESYGYGRAYDLPAAHYEVVEEREPVRDVKRVHEHVTRAAVKPVEIKYGTDGYRLRISEDPHRLGSVVNAKCTLKDPEEESYVGGVINLVQYPGSKTAIFGDIWGVSPGKHGFHVHDLGDIRDGCGTTGGHYNPTGATMDHSSHGGYGTSDDGNVEVGDLGFTIANEHGQANIDQKDNLIDLSGAQSVIGRAIVVHEVIDKTSQMSGARIGCCVIGLAPGAKPVHGYAASPEPYRKQEVRSYGYAAQPYRAAVVAPKSQGPIASEYGASFIDDRLDHFAW